MSGGNDYSFQDAKEKQQLPILTQLLRIMPTMRNLDEVFGWLASTIVQRFDVQLLQLWALQINQLGQHAAQLHAMVAQDPSLPERAIVNEQITRTIALIAGEQSPPTPQPVEHIFPYYQASLLKRCGLHYCTHCSLESSVTLFTWKSSHPYDRMPTRLIITAVIFLRQIPHPDPTPIIRNILEQALIMAESRGALTPHTPPPRQPIPPQPIPREPVPPQPEPQQELALPLADLIPRRKQDPDILMSSNPFASPIAIADKQARRLHAAIDGHKNVEALCSSTGIDLREAFAALQILLTQNRIELYEPGGRPVPASYLQKYR